MPVIAATQVERGPIGLTLGDSRSPEFIQPVTRKALGRQGPMGRGSHAQMPGMP